MNFFYQGRNRSFVNASLPEVTVKSSQKTITLSARSRPGASHGFFALPLSKRKEILEHDEAFAFRNPTKQILAIPQNRRRGQGHQSDPPTDPRGARGRFDF
jgi:hypothetical protein